MLFESHLTVEGISLPRFKAMCRQAKVKPVHIVSDTGSGVEQLMTAHFHHVKDTSKAYVEIGRLMSTFHPNVVRAKLEYIPRAVDVDRPTLFLYEEWHRKFEVAVDYVDIFRNLVAAQGFKTSLNAIRQPQDSDTVFVFVTTRNDAVNQAFKETLLASETNYWKPLNATHECVVYDTNPYLDRFWYCDCPLKSIHSGE